MLMPPNPLPSPPSCLLTLFLKVKLRGHCPPPPTPYPQPDQREAAAWHSRPFYLGHPCLFASLSSNNAAASDTEEGLVLETKTSNFPNQTPRTRPALTFTLWFVSRLQCSDFPIHSGRVPTRTNGRFQGPLSDDTGISLLSIVYPPKKDEVAPVI